MSQILRQFESVVARHPENTAIELRDRRLSFRELAARARGAGAALRGLELTRQPVGVLTDRAIEPVVGFLGALYSGSFYVPIDVELPGEKLRRVIEDAGLKVILCGRDGEALLRRVGYVGRILRFEDLPSEGDCPLPCDPDCDELYMVYTSGSTGLPKGVLKTQSAELDFIDAYWERMGFREDDVLGNQTPFYFDAAAKDLYLMLCRGLTLVMIPTELFALPPELIDYLNEKRVTVASWVPTVLSLVAQLNPFSLVKPATLRMVLFVGEVMPMKHLNVWRRALPDVTYVNLYGQSEIAGVCSFFVVEGEFADGDTLPIGKALDNSRLYLLDGDSVVTEAGRVGELYIVSRALAAGYWRDEEKTRQSFLVRDFGDGPVRCFKTGDMARYDGAGNLLFATRTDGQIKHMGHRIELGEIETAAGALSGVDRCCCLYDRETRKLVLFCQLSPGSERTGRELRSELKALLAPYMLPGKVLIMESLPLSRNGKIDREALKNELPGGISGWKN